MMEEQRWFWKNWNKEFRFHYFVLVGLASLCLIGSAVYFFWGMDAVIQWQSFQEQKEIEIALHEFTIGNFTITIPASIYVVFEFFQGGKLNPHLFTAYLYVGAMWLCFIYMQTIFSALERFSYYAGLTLLILFLVGLRLEVLKVFGLPGQWFPVLVIASFTLASYYINKFKPEWSFQKRLLTFSGITVVVLGSILLGAQVPLPFLYLSVTGYTAGLVIGVLFVFVIAQETPAIFLYLTGSQQSFSGMRHFLVIMIVYILNLVLVYVQQFKVIDISVFTFDIHFLFIVSSILGIWGWKHREARYGNIMPFQPFGAFFYIILLCFSLSFFLFLSGTSQDAPLQAWKEVSIFIFIGSAGAFLLYVLSNFLGVADKNLSVWKVLYKPNRMPYETFKLGAIIIALALLFLNNWRNYTYEALAGFWNTMGDLYVEIERPDVAQSYYEQGRNYSYNNHHSAYTIGYRYSGEYQWQLSHEYYKRAQIKKAAPFAFANDANIYNWESNTFKAIEELKEGLQAFPTETRLMVNAGFQYGKVHDLDSAFYFLQLARGDKKTKSAAEANFIGIAAQEYLPLYADSIEMEFDTKPANVKANLLGLAALTKTKYTHGNLPDSSQALNLYTATLLNNYLLQKSFVLQDRQLLLAEKIIRDSVNIAFSETLLSSFAHASYMQGQVNKALQIMSELSFISAKNQGKYNFIIGLWMLEQQNPRGAAIAFRFAKNYNHPQANYYVAIAETEAQQFIQAKISWDTVRLYGQVQEKAVAEKLLRQLSIQNPFTMTDADKYQYLRYQVKLADTIKYKMLVASMADVNMKARAFLDLSNRFYDLGNTKQALLYAKDASSLTNQVRLKEESDMATLLCIAELGDLDVLAAKLKDQIFPLRYKLYKIYFEGLLKEAAGNAKEAEKDFQYLANANAFFEDGIIGASFYQQVVKKDKFKAYEILAEAIQTNKSSVKLWKAYYQLCKQLEYDQYAEGAALEISKLLQ
ncbi:MAG: tetratricopeptide repeat protein [Chryseotalea sp.]